MSEAEADEKTPLISSNEAEPEVEVKSVPLSKLFRYASCLDAFFMVVGFLFAAVHGGGWPLLSVVFGQMTNSFIGYNASSNSSSGESFTDQMNKYALYYVYIGAAVFLASYVQVSLWTTSCERQTHKIRKAFFKAIMRQEIAWFDKYQSGELTTRLSDDLERIREGIGDKVSILMQSFAAFAAGFGVGFWKSWKMTLVMMSFTPLLAISAAFIGKIVSTFTKREQQLYAKAGSVAEETFSCIRTVISFCGQQREIDRYRKELDESEKVGKRKSFVQGAGFGFVMLCLYSAYCLAFWFGSTQVRDYYNSGGQDGLAPGDVFTVFFCVMIGSFSIGQSGPALSAVAGAKGAAAKIMEIIDNVPGIDASRPEGHKPSKTVGHVSFKGVHFAYPSRDDVPVLKNFNLEVPAGKTVALTGPSGCGKSTVINLIQRFYDPSSGEVCLDDQPIADLNIRWLRSQIGVVSQEPVLFGCSIRENIALGWDDVTQREIEEAAKTANAHDFITSLPKGYDTLVGERGAQLSGGQKQRVAIARALVRNPRILLLDEATSALDTESEKVVQEALDKARQGRTTIVVAHRLSTIKNADMIAAIEDGHVIEQGSHEDLMSLEGLYYQLVTLQHVGETFGDEDSASVVNTTRRRLSSGRSTPARCLSRQLSRQKSRTSLGGDDNKPEEEEPVELPGFFTILRLNAPEAWIILLAFCGSILIGGSMPLFAVFFSEVIKVFAKRGDAMVQEATLWALLFLALGGATGLGQFISNFCLGISGERLTKRLRLKSFEKILQQDVAFYDDEYHSTGALTTRLASDASNVRNATGIRMAVLLQSAVSMVAGLGISLYFGWKLALVVLAAVPVMAISGGIQMRFSAGKQAKDDKNLEGAGKTAAEAIENVRTVQSLGREDTFYGRYCDLLRGPYKQKLVQAQLYGLTYAFSQGAVFFLYAGCFRFGAYLVDIGDMEPNNVFKVFFAIAFTGIAVGQAFSLIPDYAKARLSTGYILKMLRTEPRIDSYSKDGLRPDYFSSDISFNEVHFDYPTRPDVHVLRGTNLQINPGQTVALVGTSGCGKSTTVSLLQRFYDPQRGKIVLGDSTLPDLNVGWLRNSMSVVAQEPVLFARSIADNIAYGLDESVPITQQMIEDAAKKANIHDFVSNLPKGYNTEVGERGAQLSGGQKQRIALARALISDPKVLLLDEATSALDTESEKVVQAALDAARKGRTCLVIAHRLSTIRNADVIFVMEQGVVVERGSHEELMKLGGAYYAMVTGQRNTDAS